VLVGFAQFVPRFVPRTLVRVLDEADRTFLFPRVNDVHPETSGRQAEHVLVACDASTGELATPEKILEARVEEEGREHRHQLLGGYLLVAWVELHLDRDLQASALLDSARSDAAGHLSRDDLIGLRSDSLDDRRDIAHDRLRKGMGLAIEDALVVLFGRQQPMLGQATEVWVGVVSLTRAVIATREQPDDGELRVVPGESAPAPRVQRVGDYVGLEPSIVSWPTGEEALRE
jgi:hypothetical protein